MSWFLVGLAFPSLGFLLPRAKAQGNELVIMQSVNASSLSGSVGFSIDAGGVANVAVVRFDCLSGPFRGRPDPVELERTKTDEQGRFKLEWAGRSRVCLQFQYPAFNLLQMEVKKKRGAGELHPKLVPGT